MTRDDTLFNWLQMKYVVEQRPNDEAAQETVDFFRTMLEEDFGISEIDVTVEGPMYVVRFQTKADREEKCFPVEFVRQLLNDIEAEPKFNEC